MAAEELVHESNLTLGDIFEDGGMGPRESAPEPQSTGEPEKATTAPPAENAEPKGEPAQTGNSEEPESTTVPLAALKNERAKRQDLERQIAQLTGRFEQLQQQSTQQPQTPEPSDPEADFLRAPVQFLEGRLKDMQQQTDARFMAWKMGHSERSARKAHEDFDEMLGVFEDAASQNPALISQMRNSEDPGEFVYQYGAAAKVAKDVGGDIGKMREQIRQEEREKLLAELKIEAAQAQPQTTAGARSAGSGPVQQPSTDLGDVMKGVSLFG